MIHVAAAVIKKNGKILIARRRPEEKMGGSWEFPGGKLEKNESVYECLEREIKEELNIDIVSGEILEESVFSYPDFDIRLTALSADIISGEIKMTVHDRYEWVIPAEFSFYNFAPADIPICRYIQKSKADIF